MQASQFICKISMAKKRYKELNWLSNFDDRDDKIQEIRNMYLPHITLFQKLFFILHEFYLEFDLPKKTRNKNNISAKKIGKSYNTYIILSLCLVKMLVPYRNRNQEETRQMQTLSDKDLILIRWVTLSYNFFVNSKLFHKIIKIYPNIKKIPDDFNNIIDFKGQWSKGDNFRKYTRTIDKEQFISIIGILCKKIDDGGLSWDLLEFLSVSIKNLLNSLDIKKRELVLTSESIHIKRSWNRMPLPDPPFEKIFFWSKWLKSYSKTRERFYRKYKVYLERKIIFWR